MFTRVAKILLGGHDPEHLENSVLIVTSESKSHFENFFQVETHVLCDKEILFVFKNMKAFHTKTGMLTCITAIV